MLRAGEGCGPAPEGARPAARTAKRPADRLPRPSLLRLSYVSAASRPLATSDLDQIAAVSQGNNASRGLTGLLVYGSLRFFGVLEGPDRPLFARMEKIVADPRHRALRVIREDRIEAPRFANWSLVRLPEDAHSEPGPDDLDSFIRGVAGRF